MASFTLSFTDEDGTVTKTFNAIFIDEVIDHFDSFLRGCGYFPDGELGIVNRDTDTPTETSFNSLIVGGDGNKIDGPADVFIDPPYFPEPSSFFGTDTISFDTGKL